MGLFRGGGGGRRAGDFFSAPTRPSEAIPGGAALRIQPARQFGPGNIDPAGRQPHGPGYALLRRILEKGRPESEIWRGGGKGAGRTFLGGVASRAGLIIEGNGGGRGRHQGAQSSRSSFAWADSAEGTDGVEGQKKKNVPVEGRGGIQRQTMWSTVKGLTVRVGRNAPERP